MSINKEGPGTRSNSSTGTEKVLGAGRHLPDTLGPSRVGPWCPGPRAVPKGRGAAGASHSWGGGRSSERNRAGGHLGRATHGCDYRARREGQCTGKVRRQ